MRTPHGLPRKSDLTPRADDENNQVISCRQRIYDSSKENYHSKKLTASPGFVILLLVYQRSSGTFEPKTRKLCKNTSFSQNSAVIGLRLAGT